MRQAPPVGVTCSGDGAWRAALVTLCAAASASASAWALLHLGATERATAPVAVLAALVAGLLAWRRRLPVPIDLRWNGRAWLAGDREGDVVVTLDLGGWMLLRWQPSAGRALWLPVSADRAGAAWHPLRTALFARRSPPAPAGEEA